MNQPDTQTKTTQGYHPGKIGRVNDDGSFYVKLDDGDSEWSIPAQQVIPAYAFAPTTSASDHGVGSPGKHGDGIFSAIQKIIGSTDATAGVIGCNRDLQRAVRTRDPSDT